MGIGVNGAEAFVLPRQDRPAGAVGDYSWKGLIIGVHAYRNSIHRPLDRTRSVYPLGIDVRVEAAIVVPRDDRPAGAVGRNLGIHLIPRCVT